MKKLVLSALFAFALQSQADVFSPINAQQIPRGTPPKVTQPPVENPNLFRGQSVAILASHGVEESEIRFPYTYLVSRGAHVDILVPSWTPQGITASQFLMPSLFVKATGTFQQALRKKYDLIILTGGAWNAQVVRSDNEALTLIRNHYQNRGPIAAICAGTSVLINAGLAKGLMMTGSPVVRLDLQNAGAVYQDKPLVTNKGIATSRSPDDLEYFVVGIRQLLIGR